MYLLEIDLAHHRVHITLSERFDEPQAKALLDELGQRLGELERGFHVLCDLTTLEEFDHSARRCFRDAMDLCNKAGVRKIIRIVPDPLHDFGLTVMSHFHYNSEVPIITCKNFNEVLEHLE